MSIIRYGSVGSVIVNHAADRLVAARLGSDLCSPPTPRQCEEMLVPAKERLEVLLRRQDEISDVHDICLCRAHIHQNIQVQPEPSDETHDPIDIERGSVLEAAGPVLDSVLHQPPEVQVAGVTGVDEGGVAIGDLASLSGIKDAEAQTEGDEVDLAETHQHRVIKDDDIPGRLANTVRVASPFPTPTLKSSTNGEAVAGGVGTNQGPLQRLGVKGQEKTNTILRHGHVTPSLWTE